MISPQFTIYFHRFLAVILTLSAAVYPSKAYPDQGTPYQAVPGLIDLRSTFSDGSHSIEEIVQMASSRGFRVLFINDHDRITVSYGIPPFRRILRYKKEFPSIMTHGPERFLNEIKRVSQKYPHMIIVPGCETSAYYYWSGSWFNKDLTLHEYDRKILIINFTRAEDYELIPNMHNQLSLKYTGRLLPGLLLLLVPLIIGIILIYRKGLARWAGLLIIIFSALSIIDYNPFRSSLFSPYEGDQGVAPHQELIDYVNRRGGLPFWNYPEQASGIRAYGPIRLNTPPYPQVLYQSRDYAGFAAIYGAGIKVTEPGNQWDRVLNEYCRGLRERPPWGISTADFHRDGHLGLKLGAFPTIFLVKTYSREGILEAMKKGRMYSSRGDGRFWLRLDYFNVKEKEKEEAVMGETITTSRFPVIRFRISQSSEQKRPVTVHLIRGGTLIQSFESETPLEVTYMDKEAPPGEKTFYRLLDSKKNLTSNPIFVTYKPSSTSK